MPIRIFLALILFAAAPTFARQPPPEEAFAACNGIGEGGGCRFQGRMGPVAGQCRIMREGRLVCVPSGGPGPGGNAGPGQEAGGGFRPEGTGPGRRSGRRPFTADIAGSNPMAIKVASGIPDTHQGSCFDTAAIIPCPAPGAPFYGQDAQYEGARPAYRDNGDGTISDLVTGLTWQKAHNATRLGYDEAAGFCGNLDLGGHRDWRLPSIKELFSLADFRGSQGRRPYLDDVFDFRAPGRDVLEGDRFASHEPGMMGQTWSSTIYTGVHYGRPGVEAAFFFNFLDGHIKQAPVQGRNKLFYRCVRGPAWGESRFADLGHGMVEDKASGLVWQQADDGKVRDWPEALAYCENLKLGGKKDWRLPNVKELESIVDYRRHAPALDERYLKMTDPKGWFWSSTTHGDNIRHAAYVCFGPCTSVDGVDVHGAGAQRSAPKVGNPADFGALGGQRDEVRIGNYVRCVR